MKILLASSGGNGTIYCSYGNDATALGKALTGLLVENSRIPGQEEVVGVPKMMLYRSVQQSQIDRSWGL